MSGIRELKRQPFGVRLALFEDAGPREDEALLVHVGRIEYVAGVLGAQVDPVRAHAQVGLGTSDTGLEHAREQSGVGRVGGVTVGIVHQQDVARLDVLDADVLHAFHDAVVVRAEEAREPRRLRDQIQVLVVDRDPEVQHVIDDRAEGCADERGAHLLRCRNQIVADDLHGDAVDGALVQALCLHRLCPHWSASAEADSAPATAVMIRWPNLSTSSTWSLKMMVVDVPSSMMAGPLRWSPGVSFPRW